MVLSVVATLLGSYRCLPCYWSCNLYLGIGRTAPRRSALVFCKTLLAFSMRVHLLAPAVGRTTAPMLVAYPRTCCDVVCVGDPTPGPLPCQNSVGARHHSIQASGSAYILQNTDIRSCRMFCTAGTPDVRCFYHPRPTADRLQICRFGIATKAFAARHYQHGGLYYGTRLEILVLGKSTAAVRRV